ncbi:MAG: diguanylate cyclase [Oricola sp.]
MIAGINILGEELEAYGAEIREADESLRQALEYARTLIRSSPDGILAVDRDLRITEWNLVMEQICGEARETSLGRVPDEIQFMRDTGEARRLGAGINGKGIPQREIAYQAPGAGGQRFYESVMAPLHRPSGVIQGAVMRIRDITDSKSAEKRLRLASLYARSLIEAGLDPLVTISTSGEIMDANEAAVTGTGVPRETLIGSNFSKYFTDPDKADAGYREAFTNGTVRNYPLTMRHVSGRLTEVLYHASVFYVADGGIAGVLAVARDITDRKRAEQAEELARRDSLTALFNHRTFHELLKEEAARTRRFNRPVSLLMIDIDHFKQVNDNCGHQAGDAILRGLSDLLVRQARAVDHVCRYGGEEFTVILPETDEVVAMQIAERLRAEVQRQRFDIGGGKKIGITVSIGVATHPEQAESPDGLIRAADTAVYAAKRGGRNRVSHYKVKQR